MDDQSLTEFIDSVCGESHLRVEADLGDGFVRLRSSEAERRQAAQDIRSSEDIVIELLRNARDAGARHIFLASQRYGDHRCLTIIDDGAGIPASQHERIFEPRVTSKLDTAHMDKWGMHGRGMALYSISVNAEEARVCNAAPEKGTSIVVQTDTTVLGEKTDQSTFPHFEKGAAGALAMRGPKNIVRTAAEFALEHRGECTVYEGTATEIAATLYAYGAATLSPALRAFQGDPDAIPLAKRLALAVDDGHLSQLAETMGLSLSPRSARRIMDGTLRPVPSLMERLEMEALPCAGAGRSKAKRPVRADGRGLKLADADLALIQSRVSEAFDDIAERYFLAGVGQPEISVGADAVRITIPIDKMH